MLKNISLKHSYSTGYYEPKEFFTEALIESNSFDLGLGFFSSSGIRTLSHGFALFIANGGIMRVVINQILSEDDKKAIEAGQNNKIDDFEQRIISNIEELTQSLSKANDLFFRCFAYLISIKRIEFIATISTKGGIGHDKYGIFTDDKGNKVAFIGSANWSQTALEYNSETITVFSSWEDDKRVIEYQKLFDDSWEKDTPHLIHIPLERVKTHIAGKFQLETLSELLQAGAELRDLNELNENKINPIEKPLSDSLKEKLAIKELEPRFPFPEERDIQKDAYKAWLNNNSQGIFAMATGSGKTVTALNCALKQYKENGYYKILIIVPTQALAVQWEKEVSSFNFQNIVSTYSDKDWKDIINRYVTRSIFDTNKNIVLITTYATFNRKDIQSFLANPKVSNNFIYIADEAHNLGSPTSLKHLPYNITKRIGLSATPERIYDEIGSSIMYDFFNSKPPHYTYRYTMKQAIDDKILCTYDYYPIFVELTTNEMEEYRKITRQLCSFIDPKTNKYTKDAEKLLLKRKRIIHKAQNKKIAVSSLIDELQVNKKIDFTFVFVPEGYEPNYSEIDEYLVESEDVHIIDEYAELFKKNGYTYHKYISGLNDAEDVLKNFANGYIKVLLSMKCLDEGIDIPRAEHAIFCSSTGNPRQFVQRRGRVLRKCKGKDSATIWDLIVIPPDISGEISSADKNMFQSEVKRIVNFAALASNQIQIVYGELKGICYQLNINLFDMLEQENEQYK